MRRIIAIALAAALAAGAAQAETLKVAIGQKGNWDTSIIDFGIKQGFFKEANIDVDALYTEGGASTQEAVISGSVDIGIANGLLGIIGAYVKGAPVRVISAQATGAGDLFWYAKAESGIKSLKDAGGKTIGFSSPGSSSNLVLLALIEQAGVKAKPVATGGIPATLTQVMSGQIDIGWSVPPAGLQAVDEGKLVIVARGNDVPELKNETVRVNLANLEAIKAKRDAITRFMQVYQRSLDWAYQDPKAIDYFAEGMHVPRALAQKARDEFYPKQALEIGEVKGLDRVLREALDYKRIPKPMTPDEIAGLFDIVYKPK